MISSANSKILNNVRIPLALGVFLSHAASDVDINIIDTFKMQGGIESISYWIFTFLSTLMPILVIPGFFLISGYLFFLKWTQINDTKIWDWKCYNTKLRSRIFSLLIPYIIWNIIPLLILIVECVILNFNSSSLLQELRFCLQGKFPQMFWNLNKWGGGCTGPLNLPLYYLRDLMCMCLVAPIVFVYCKKTKVAGVVTLIALYVAGVIPSVSGFRNTGITFFTLGAFISIKNKDIVEVLCRYGKLLFIPSLLLIPIVLGGIQFLTAYKVYTIRLFSVVGLVTLFCIVQKITRANIISFPKLFVQSIFFSYAAHEGFPLLLFSTFISRKLIPASSAFMFLLQYVMSIILVILLCLVLYKLLKSYVPFWANLLNGKCKLVIKRDDET